jgi:hypothetical protein
MSNRIADTLGPTEKDRDRRRKKRNPRSALLRIEKSRCRLTVGIVCDVRSFVSRDHNQAPFFSFFLP